MKRVAILLALSLSSSTASSASAEEATFALVVGVNESVDPAVPQLSYADDDAIEFAKLFERLGARVQLLTTLDENTRRLYPHERPREASSSELDAAVARLSFQVEAAKQRGASTTLFFIYAGHGNVDGDRGYVSLKGARLTGDDLADRVVAKISAARKHVIVDACNSYFLAHGRGPGGERRPLTGFSQLHRNDAFDGVGLVLSTSSAQESHEWTAFQAGVFSYEVRSALYGAADADGDAKVSYRELGAFVSRANAAIPNERFRPAMFIRSPPGGEVLVDLDRSSGGRIEIDASRSSHYLLEDARGVRLAEFHSAPEQSVRLMRPAAPGALYLRRMSDQKEYELPQALEVVSVSALTAREPREQARGAAHHAFSLIFSLPFDRASVDAYRDDVPLTAEVALDSSTPALEIAGYSTLAAAGAGAIAGVALTLSALALRDDAESGGEVARLNERIQNRNLAAVVLYVFAGAAAAAGTTMLLWDSGAEGMTVTTDGTNLMLGYGAAF